MAIEIVFGCGLGDPRVQAEQTVLTYRGHEDITESSFVAFASSLRDLLTGMAQATAEYTFAPEGARFYFLLVVSKPTLSLDLNQTVRFEVTRTYRLSVREQMGHAAVELACRLADLGTPRWLNLQSPHDVRTPHRLTVAELLS